MDDEKDLLGLGFGRGWAPLVAEFGGTFMLVFASGCVRLATESFTLASLAMVGVTVAAVYSLAVVSGAHLNPAVSIAWAITSKGQLLKRRTTSILGILGSYVLTQVVAGIAAVYCVKALYGTTPMIGPKTDAEWWEAMIVEAVYTAVLCYVWLNVMVSRRNNPDFCRNQFFGLAVGFVSFAGGHAARSISGASFNPALSIPLDVASGLYLDTGFEYTAFEVMGACLAAVLFRISRPEEFSQAISITIYRPKLPTKLICEYVGTFVFVFSMGLSMVSAPEGTPWAIASAYLCMIYAVGDVSGGHFNPAVTLATVLSGRNICHIGEGILYVLVQVAAAFNAGLLSAAVSRGATVKLQAEHPYNLASAVILEGIFTFVVVLVYLATGTVKGTVSRLPQRNFYYGLAIGATIAGCSLALQKISGGELNPAACVGLAVVNTINSGNLHECWMFCVSQLLGGVLAVLVFFVTNASAYQRDFRPAVRKEDSPTGSETRLFHS